MCRRQTGTKPDLFAEQAKIIRIDIDRGYYSQLIKTCQVEN